MPILFFCKRHLVFVIISLCFFYLLGERIVVAQSKGTSTADRISTSVFQLLQENVCQVYGINTVKGTAFIIHPSGIAVASSHTTNANFSCKHASCDEIKSGYLRSGDKITYSYQIIGRAAQYELAFLRIKESGSFVPISISEHEAGINENAFCLYNHDGLAIFCVRGYLSAISEWKVEHFVHPKMRVYNMPTVVGASGAPIMSNQGDVVAVAIGHWKDIYTLAIPSSDILPAIKKVANLETVFGLEVGIQYETKRLSDKTGIFVSKVADNSEAEKTGIVVGDQVIAIGQWEVNSAVDFELSALAWVYKTPNAPMAIKVKKQDGTLADLQIRLTQPTVKHTREPLSSECP
jgi:S1-C subfamily serine protease